MTLSRHMYNILPVAGRAGRRVIKRMRAGLMCAGSDRVNHLKR